MADRFVWFRRQQVEPGTARRQQVEPGTARRQQVGAGSACRQQVEPGTARPYPSKRGPVVQFLEGYVPVGPAFGGQKETGKFQLNHEISREVVPQARGR